MNTGRRLFADWHIRHEPIWWSIGEGRPKPNATPGAIALPIRIAGRRPGLPNKPLVV